MKLKFIVDQKYDETMARSFGFSKDKLKKIKSDYRFMLPYLELTKDLYHKSWDDISNGFSRYVERETGHKWFYPEYECVISVAHSGIANWGFKPKIVRSWKENPYYMRRITAHELILSHYFEIYKRYYKKEKLKLGQVWALAEIAAFALTSLNAQVKEFWPWNTEYYIDHNYPHIVDLQNKLKVEFMERKSFNDYMKKGIILVRKYPGMNPNGL
jgi:hypothetical protein